MLSSEKPEMTNLQASSLLQRVDWVIKVSKLSKQVTTEV